MADATAERPNKRLSDGYRGGNRGSSVMVSRGYAISVMVVAGLLGACGAKEPDASQSGSRTKNAALAATCASGGECKIGDTGPGGGVVFFDAGSGMRWGRYLEAARTNLADNVSWCDKKEGIFGSGAMTSGGETVNARATKAMGKGFENTSAIATRCSSGAARRAWDLVSGGKDDWFLPSMEEARAMVDQRVLLGLPSNPSYWTSTEDSPTAAIFTRMTSGGRSAKDNAYLMSARAIRAFRPTVVPGTAATIMPTTPPAPTTPATTVAPANGKPLVVKALPGNTCEKPGDYYYETTGKDAGSCVLGMAEVTEGQPCPSGYGADFVATGIRYCFRLAENLASAQTTIARSTTMSTTMIPRTTIPQTTIPQTTIPQTTIPQTTIPQTTIPQTATTTALTSTSAVATGVRCTATACRIGDTGPNGGLVFITPSTPGNASGLFFEAQVSSFRYNTVFGCGNLVLPNTGAAIGDGLKNTAQILHICGGSALVPDQFMSQQAALNDPSKAWFLPSSGELLEMNKHLKMLKGQNPFNYGEFWSSTASGDGFLAINLAGQLSPRRRNAGYDFALVAAFKPDLSIAVIADTARTYGIGDIGPAGGRVFITPSTPGNTTGNYFEVAPSNWSGTELGDQMGPNFVANNKQVAWSCPDYQSTSLAGTLTAIGTGQANTRLINERCASYSGAAMFATREAVNYRGGNRSDWFVPSKDELYRILIEIEKTTPNMIRRTPPPAYSIACAWSSSEANATVAWGGNQYQIPNAIYATLKSISTNCVLPVRMFLPTETPGNKG